LIKKAHFSLILLVGLLVFSLAGCGTKEEAKANETASEVSVAEPYLAVLPDGEVESDIFVTKIDGISDDFIRGIDISSLLVEEASGVVYKDEAGNEEDLLKILADAGVNYVRVRVWNDPFDENGNGYGGGNCTVDTAIAIGQRAAKYGIKTCVDFHYSDFWADPSKQMSPKAWAKMDIDEKCQALYDYTVDSLNQIIESGVDVGMVQVGNETNSGVAGVKSTDNMYRMLSRGCDAVHDVAKAHNADIKAVVHFTQIDNYEDTVKRAHALQDAGVSYDVFGVSYYPYWHGSMENMQKVLSDIESECKVETCVLETSYPYTSEDTDCSGNSISGDGDALTEYPVTVQGQAKALRDVMSYANAAGSMGVFYWEGAWISVGDDAKANSEKWETYGSGWASSYASDYDPNDAGKYYGGCSWDNQALFDKDGNPLESLNVFKYVKYGAKAPIEILAIKDVKLEFPVGVEFTMPEGVDAIYNDSNLTECVDVTWNEDDIAAIDYHQPGKYSVRGTVSTGQDIVAEVKIVSVNYVLNGSFEDGDVTMWNVEYPGESNPTDYQTKASDATSGERSFHFWSAKDVEFNMYQEITDIPAGTYSADCYIQGGDMGDEAQVKFYILINGEEVGSDSVSLSGWVDWKNPSVTDIVVSENDVVTIGVSVKGAPGGWGTMDDFELY